MYQCSSLWVGTSCQTVPGSQTDTQIEGVGTKEDMLNDVLIGRSNADMHAIKAKYQEVFKKPLDYDVESDLSLKTKTMFQLIMSKSSPQMRNGAPG